MALVSTRSRTAGQPEDSAFSQRHSSSRAGGVDAGAADERPGDALASNGWSLARTWRQIRLGLSFAQFGLTALGVAFVAAPLLRRRARSSEAAELAVQRAIHRAYRLSVALWKAVGLIRVDATGAAGIARQGTCIVVANHPTLIDVVLMGSLLEQMDCIVNAGWTAHSPFLARAIEVAGYLPNDSGQTMVDECAQRLARGRTLLVFPEGTRSPWPRPGQEGEKLGKFHRGAAHIALASGVPIVAVTIACTPRFVGSGRKWHEVPDGPSCFTLRVAARFDPKDYAAGGDSLPLQARRLTSDIRKIFLQEPSLADA